MFKHILTDYNEKEHLYALNNQNVYVSHSKDFRPNPLTHVHNSCELLFIEKGAGRYHIGNEDYEVSANSVLIIGATDPHSRVFTEVPCSRYGLTIMPAYLENFSNMYSYLNIFLTHSPKEAGKLQNIDENTFQRMLQILLLIKKEIDDSDARGKKDMIYALLLELAVLLRRLLGFEKQKYSSTWRVMADIKEFIDSHYMEELNLSGLSRQFYLQPNTISKNFGKFFRKNISTYINSVRISNAVRILESSDINIIDLSEMVGYTSVNTFLRQFRERMNISPLQYKKKYEKYIQESKDIKHTFDI